MSLSADLIEKINNQVYRQFPTLQGVHPTVSATPADQYQLVYKGKGKTPGGQTIHNTVKVIVSPTGKVLKLSSTR